MIEEMLERFPEMVKALLEKASQANSVSDTPERKAARDKLISQLQGATEELSRLSKTPGEGFTEEQIKKLLEIPRPLPQLPWTILQQAQKGKK